jgi:hypothetical protein
MSKWMLAAALSSISQITSAKCFFHRAMIAASSTNAVKKPPMALDGNG